MAFFYLFGALICLILVIIVWHVAGGVAEDKGYDRDTWFWICLFLPFGLWLLIALPDRKLQEEQKRTNELLQMLLEKKDYVDISQITSEQKGTDRHTFDDLPNI